MTRRSLNLIRFCMRLAFLSVPAATFGAAILLHFKAGVFSRANLQAYSYAAPLLVVTVVWALVVEYLQLNRVETLVQLQTGIQTAARATLWTAIIVLALSFFYRGTIFSLIFFALGSFLTFVISLGLIHLLRFAVRVMAGAPNYRLRFAILGADDFALRVAQTLRASPLVPCEVACFVALPNQVPAVTDCPVIEWSQLHQVADVFHCREALIAVPFTRSAELQQIVHSVQWLCIPTRVVLDIGDGVLVPDRIFDFYGLRLLDLRPYPVDTVRYTLGKRAFDLAFSACALLLGALFMLVISLVIKLSSPGPVLFTQERVSLNGKRFKMLKFRTMVVQDYDDSNSRHTGREDPRVTTVGRFLRKTSLDELPQFVNVLRGDMSVVGPRPELTFFVEKFRQEIPVYMARHNVKCGITGWAQINGLRGSDTSIPRRIEYDLHYMKHWSMLFDLKIILLTLVSGFVTKNAY